MAEMAVEGFQLSIIFMCLSEIFCISLLTNSTFLTYSGKITLIGKVVMMVYSLEILIIKSRQETDQSLHSICTSQLNLHILIIYSETFEERPHWGWDVCSLLRGWSHLGGFPSNSLYHCNPPHNDRA